MTRGSDKTRPLWDIQGWSRDGLISSALQEAYKVPDEGSVTTALRDLIHEIRQQED